MLSAPGTPAAGFQAFSINDVRSTQPTLPDEEQHEHDIVLHELREVARAQRSLEEKVVLLAAQHTKKLNNMEDLLQNNLMYALAAERTRETTDPPYPLVARTPPPDERTFTNEDRDVTEVEDKTQGDPGRLDLSSIHVPRVVSEYDGYVSGTASNRCRVTSYDSCQSDTVESDDKSESGSEHQTILSGDYELGCDSEARTSQRASKRTRTGAAISLPPTWPMCIQVRTELMSLDPGISMQGIEDAFFHRQRRQNRWRFSRLSSNHEGSVTSAVPVLNFTSPSTPCQPGVLDPNGALRLTMDMVCILALVHDLAIIPFMIAWGLKPDRGLKGLGYVITMYWTFDLILGFVTGYYSDGQLVMKLRQIALHYVRTWFIPDFLLVTAAWADILMDVVGADASSAQMISVLRLMKLSRLFRVAGLLRLARLNKMVERRTAWFLSDNARLAFQVLKLIVATAFFSHLIACAWYALGRWGPSDTGHHWMGNFPLVSGESVAVWYQYATSFHWTIAQITLGAVEVYPANTYERVFNIVLLLFGLIFGSTIVSFISALTLQVMMSKRDQTQKLSLLRKYINQNSIHPSLAARVQQQVMERMEVTRQLTEDDVHILSMLSSSLRLELIFQTRRPHILTHPLFRLWMELDVSAVKLLCVETLKFVFLNQGDDLFKPGEQGHDAYLLTRGRCKYTQEPDSSHVTDEEKKYVDEGQWICEAALWSHWTHVGKLEAAELCQFLVVSAEGVARVALRRHVTGKITRDYCKNFHVRIVSARPPHAPWPDDLHVPFTDAGELFSQQVGIGLLNHERRMGLTMSISDKSLLEEELRNEKCALRWAQSSKELERTVYVVALHVTDAEGRILAQVGKLNEHGEVSALCLLPGTKRGRDELPHQALDRILQERLAPLADGISFTGIELDVKEKGGKDATYGVKTKYYRTIHIATMDPTHRSLWLQVAKKDNTGHKTNSANGHHCMNDAHEFGLDTNIFGFKDGKKVWLYSWLKQSDFEFLSERRGNTLLKTWLHSFHLDPEVNNWRKFASI